jgi:hypothetical protein
MRFLAVNFYTYCDTVNLAAVPGEPFQFQEWRIRDAANSENPNRFILREHNEIVFISKKNHHQLGGFLFSDYIGGHAGAAAHAIITAALTGPQGIAEKR